MPNRVYQEDDGEYRAIKHTLTTEELEARTRPFARLEALVFLLIAMLLLNLVAQGVSILQNNDAKQATLTNRTTGYASRAVSCQVVAALAGPEIDACKLPAVRAQYDPQVVSGIVATTTRNRALTCLMVRKIAPDQLAAYELSIGQKCDDITASK